MTDDPFGDAAQQNALQPRATVRRHDDQMRAEFFGKIANLVSGIPKQRNELDILQLVVVSDELSKRVFRPFGKRYPA